MARRRTIGSAGQELSVPVRVYELLVEQVRHELVSSLNYTLMSNWCSLKGWWGGAHFFSLQAKEEYGHFEKLVNYFKEMSLPLSNLSIERLDTSSFKSYPSLFTLAYEWEKENTRAIHNLYRTAMELGDYATAEFLHWFIAEQREEEHLFSEIVDRLTVAGEDPAALLHIDYELGKREG